jgi:hypothetical protein
VPRAVNELCLSQDVAHGAGQELVESAKHGAIDLLLWCGWYYGIKCVVLTAR